MLRTRKVVSGRIIWKEDVHHWHPGQKWIWEPGGFGVFDPGINALSVLTTILPRDICVEGALLEFPENQQSPIAAQMRMRTEDGVEVNADFDFRQKGEQSWDIEIKTSAGNLKLSKGGAVLAIDGKESTADESLAASIRGCIRASRTSWRTANPKWIGGIPAGGGCLPDRRTSHRRCAPDRNFCARLAT